MILIDDVKYSCLECIRGHRTSKCRHHVRPLLQVRFRGRPTAINGNPNHRIAVFAEEVSENGQNDGETSPTPDVTNRCASKSNAVVILKTSAKQVIDLSDGRILGLYDELQKSGASSCSKPNTPIIKDTSFVNSSICCLTGKIDKSCGCCENKFKKLNKQRILKKYLQKHLNDRPALKQEPTKEETVTMVAAERDSRQIFDVVSVPSCSIPGSCCCDDSCSCEGCMVHSKKAVSSNQMSSDMSLDYVNNHTQFGMPLPQTLLDENTDMVLNSFFQGPVQYLDAPISEMSGPLFESYASFISQQLKDPSAPTDELLGSTCSCAATECDCTNCETHGIINGMKLDELFFNPQFDPKNVSLLYSEAPNGTEVKDEGTAALLAMISKSHPPVLPGASLNDGTTTTSEGSSKEPDEKEPARSCCL